MTKAGKGRPDPKQRMGQKIKVLKNTPGNPLFENFDIQNMTYEEYMELMKRLNKANETNKKFFN